MKRWTKRKTIISGIVALLIAVLLGAGVYAIHKYIDTPEIKTYTQQSRPWVDTTPEPPKDVTAEEVIAGVNAERVKAGLGALVVNALLNQSACLKADDMIAKNYWSHVSPVGTKPWHWFDLVGYDYVGAGENQAYGFATSDAIVQGWMNSPGHKANIMNQSYTEMGMCVRYGDYQGSHRLNVIVNHFATPR